MVQAWMDRTHKAVTRDLIFRKASSLPPAKISYLGLPGTSFAFEERLLRSLPLSKMTLFERDSKIYSSILPGLSALSCPDVSLLNQDVDDYFLSPDVSPNLIWLDYCGPITVRRLRTLNSCLSIIKSNGGILATTYLAGRESHSVKGFLSLFAQGLISGSSLFGSTSISRAILTKAQSVADIATFFAGPLKVTVQPYMDNVSMLLFIFQFNNSSNSTEVEFLPYLKGH